ncbi:unnamed protein product [Brassica oleracea var. botrytis]
MLMMLFSVSLCLGIWGCEKFHSIADHESLYDAGTGCSGARRYWIDTARQLADFTISVT